MLRTPYKKGKTDILSFSNTISLLSAKKLYTREINDPDILVPRNINVKKLISYQPFINMVIIEKVGKILLSESWHYFSQIYVHFDDTVMALYIANEAIKQWEGTKLIFGAIDKR